jgi:hypothetical protein
MYINAYILKKKKKKEEKDNCAPSLAGEVSETTRRREHDEGNVNVTENGELISLFNESISPFGESNLAIRGVFYSFYWEFNPTHSKQGKNKNLQKQFLEEKVKKKKN